MYVQLNPFSVHSIVSQLYVNNNNKNSSTALDITNVYGRTWVSSLDLVVVTVGDLLPWLQIPISTFPTVGRFRGSKLCCSRPPPEWTPCNIPSQSIEKLRRSHSPGKGSWHASPQDDILRNRLTHTCPFIPTLVPCFIILRRMCPEQQKAACRANGLCLACDPGDSTVFPAR